MSEVLGASQGRLVELVARLERATGPDRTLGDDVLLACGWAHVLEGHQYHWEPPGCHGKGWRGHRVDEGDRPNPLASIDTALTLVPEGYNISIGMTTANYARADIWKPDDRKTEQHSDGSRGAAIALVIAALKAHAAQGPRQAPSTPSTDTGA